jgi:hypothetical protein
MKKDKKPEIFVNTILIHGNMRGLFCSSAEWFHLGSKRALVELVLGEYHAEADIDIISHHLDGLPFVSEE